MMAIIVAAYLDNLLVSVDFIAFLYRGNRDVNCRSVGYCKEHPLSSFRRNILYGYRYLLQYFFWRPFSRRPSHFFFGIAAAQRRSDPPLLISPPAFSARGVPFGVKMLINWLRRC